MSDVSLSETKPNDQGLLLYWRQYLENKSNENAANGHGPTLEIILDTDLKSLNIENNHIVSATFDGQLENINFGQNDKVILAMPPMSIINTLSEKSKNLIGESWAKDTDYLSYIPIIYHFNKNIELPKIWGFPASDWGVAFIILFDNQQLSQNNQHQQPQKTIISTCITRPNAVSRYTGKTANQSTKSELIDEVFRQLQQAQPLLKKADIERAIVSPGVYRDENEWKTKDTAFMLTTLGFMTNSKLLDNLYTVGPHLQQAQKTPHYSFTSMESAVTSAIDLLNNNFIKNTEKIKTSSYWTLNQAIFIAFLFIIIFIIYIFSHNNVFSYNHMFSHNHIYSKSSSRSLPL